MACAAMSASAILAAAVPRQQEDAMVAGVRAAQGGQVSELRQLLESKALRASDRDHQGCSLLQWAAINGRTEVLSLLLSHGADPSAVGGLLQETPLQWAARQGHVEVMCQLLQTGLSCPGHKNVEGRDALFLCVMQANRRGILLLAAYGADVNTTDSAGLSPLLFACKYRPQNLSLIRTLLTLGADPSSQLDAMGSSCLHHVACQAAGGDLIRTLRGADRRLCFRRNREGKDPVMLARDKGTRALASYLARVRIVQRLPSACVACVPALMVATIISGLNIRGILGALVAMVFAMSMLVRYHYALLPRQQDYLGMGFTAVIIASISVLYLSSLQGRQGLIIDVVFLSLSFFSLYYLSKVRMMPGQLTSSPKEALQVLLLSSKREEPAAATPSSSSSSISGSDSGAGAMKGAPVVDFRRCCDGCLAVKTARSRHCLSCGRCVRGYDHHCAFLGSCVWEENHQDFMMFCLSSTLTLALWLVLACRHLWSSSSPLTTTEGRPVILFSMRRSQVVIFCLAAVCFIWLVAVTSFQLWLIGLDLTSFEFFRQTSRSPLSLRKWCRNVVRFFFTTSSSSPLLASSPPSSTLTPLSSSLSSSTSSSRTSSPFRLHHRPNAPWEASV